VEALHIYTMQCHDMRTSVLQVFGNMNLLLGAVVEFEAKMYIL